MAKELQKIKNEKNTLKIKGREREVKFNFSAWAKLEEEYNGLEDFGNIEKDITEKPFNTIPHLIYIALQDKEGVTEADVLDEYGLADMPLITQVLYSALYGSLPVSEKKKEMKAE